MNAKCIASRIVKDAGDDTLAKTIEWIGNLNDAFGRDTVLDYMPNNFGGTIAIQSLIDAAGSGTDETALLRAAKYTLENLDAAEKDKLITAPRSFQAQLGQSAEMLRKAIGNR